LKLGVENLSSAEVATKDTSLNESPPSPAVFGLVLLIVGAIGFSPWLIAKYARETPAPAKGVGALQQRWRNWQRSNLTQAGVTFSGAAEKALQLERDQKFEQAIEQYTLLLESPHNKALNYLGRGKCYLNLKRLDLAISDFTNSIALNPYDGDAYTYRAAAYHRLGQEEKAAIDLTEARKHMR
jgi:tetratricopeptide (TPR) repeat protein